MATAERWLAVPDYEGFYDVSDHGQVRSLPRTITRSNGTPYWVRGQLLVPPPEDDGRPTVTLYRGPGGGWQVYVYQLVLTAFVGPCPPGMEGRHLDGNAAHSHLTNLQWGTSLENKLDTLAHGTNHWATKERCPLEHLLISPNLEEWLLPRRKCRSCGAAISARYKARLAGRPFDFKAYANARYRKIMEVVR